jgi:hypothetical protein
VREAQVQSDCPLYPSLVDKGNVFIGYARPQGECRKKSQRTPRRRSASSFRIRPYF